MPLVDIDFRILLVEDEENLQESIKLNLELEDYEVVTADNGKDALKIFDNQRFNLVILDVMMPEMDGFEVCEKIRLVNDDIPVLFLTAKDQNQDKIKGLKLGADDYLTKPFNLEEFLLRVKRLLRHSVKGTSQAGELKSFRFGGNTVDFQTYEAVGLKGKFNLTKKEALLLKLLIEKRNEVVSRQQILKNVWEYDVLPATRTIDNFILTFRKNFEAEPKNPMYFHSVRGVGYKFVYEG